MGKNYKPLSDPPPLPVIKIYISQSWTSVEMLELQDSEARIGSLANLVDQLSDCSYKVQVKVKVMWCIYIAPFPFGYARRRFTIIVYPQRTGSIYIYIQSARSVSCMLVLILPTPEVNYSRKEGHPNIQPSTRPGIEPGT